MGLYSPRALGEKGIRTVVLEWGRRLPRAPENWSPHRVFVDDTYKDSGAWLYASGGTFKPGVHYWVGGNTKVYYMGDPPHEFRRLTPAAELLPSRPSFVQRDACEEQP